MRRGLYRAAVSALALLAAGAAPAEPLALVEGDVPIHELIFSRHSDPDREDYDLWRVCADGTQLASLVVAPGHQLQASVSPDGSEIAYRGTVDGQHEVFRRPLAAQGEAINLTDHPANDSGPAWGPDGRRLAFFSDRDAAKPELWILDLGSGALERRTRNALHESGAAWSPDQDRIVFTRFTPATDAEAHSGAGELVALDLASGAETALTSLGGYNGDASFSPDGRTLAFHRSADGRAELWLADADGANPRPITDTFVDEYTPRWSPDGRWIAFTAGTGHDGLGTFDLWLARSDGSDRRLLLAAANTEAWHVWRPAHRCR